jgi:hypothetical protein
MRRADWPTRPGSIPIMLILTDSQSPSIDYGIKKMGQAGKCWDEAEKDFKLPKYESVPGYANGLPFVARRYCSLWGRGT